MWSSDWSTIRLGWMLKQLDVHDLHMNTHKLKCQHPTQIQLIFNSNSKTTNNQQQTEKNQQRADKKQKVWPALGEVKAGDSVEGGPEDEAPADREEEEAFWVEPAFTHKEKTSVSARSPRNLPVFALALSAWRRWLTAYLSSHLVIPVLWRFCVMEACSESEATSSLSSLSDTSADGAGSSSSLIWMLHASVSWFEWCSTWQLQRRASNPNQPPLFASSVLGNLLSMLPS